MTPALRSPGRRRPRATAAGSHRVRPAAPYRRPRSSGWCRRPPPAAGRRARFVASGRLATVLTLSTPACSVIDRGLVDRPVVWQRRRQSQQQSAVQRASRAAHLPDQRHRRLLEVVASTAEVGRVEIGHRLHPAHHVAAVVGVADLAVQVGQQLLVRDHGISEGSHPCRHRPGRQLHQGHQVIPGVETGASHSRSISSSARSRVIEAPAIRAR